MRKLVAYFRLDAWARPIASRYPVCVWVYGMASCAFSIFAVLEGTIGIFVGHLPVSNIVTIVLSIVALLLSYALVDEAKSALRRERSRKA